MFALKVELDLTSIVCSVITLACAVFNGPFRDFRLC